MPVTSEVTCTGHTEERIGTGHRYATVSEVRHAPYVHEGHRPDDGFCAQCWRCGMSGDDRVTRWSTAVAVLGVAAVAVVASYEHAYVWLRRFALGPPWRLGVA